MANALLTINQITNEALNVLEKEMGYVEYRVEGCSGAWVIVERKWGKSTNVVSNHQTKKEAQAMLKLLQFTRD
jgi:hypothetical protein